ncbi:MAG TPA: response regulator [Nocardioides sp.]|nr:response regulator [Nocardioides sp.]
MSGSRTGGIRVVVADDDVTMRRAMVDVLNAHGGFSIVAEAASGVGLAELVAETDAQLVVLDVRMPSGGADAARTLRARPPYPVVVAVSASTDIPTIAAMVRAGATGFLAKGHLGTTFADDLVRCTRGQVMIAVPQGAQVMRAIGGTVEDRSADPG